MSCSDVPNLAFEGSLVGLLRDWAIDWVIVKMSRLYLNTLLWSNIEFEC